MRPFHRLLSSEVKLSCDDNGICTLDLNKPPVNSLGLEFMETIIEAFDQVEKEKQYKGMVLTSTNKSIFCAGLDLQEMYQPDEKRWFSTVLYAALSFGIEQLFFLKKCIGFVLSGIRFKNFGFVCTC